MTGHYPSRVSPFGHPRVIACLTARRGFSQLATPFFACPRQGILRMPLVACPHVTRVELPLAYTRLLSFRITMSKNCFSPPTDGQREKGERLTFVSPNHGADRDRTDDLRLA